MGREKCGVCGSEVERVDDQEQLLNKNADWIVKKAVKKSVLLSTRSNQILASLVTFRVGNAKIRLGC